MFKQGRKSQRAENGGLEFVVVGFGVFGAAQFSVQRSQNTYFKGFGDLWSEN